MGEDNKELEYFISEKGDFLVVSFVGIMTKNTITVLEECLSEVEKSESKSVVLNFHDVTELTRSTHRILSQIQAAIRKKRGKIRICFINPKYKKELIDLVIIREGEVVENLKQAIMDLGPTGYPFEDYVSEILKAKGYDIIETSNEWEGKEKVLPIPNMIMPNDMFSQKHEIVKTLKFKKGGEDVLFLFLAENKMDILDVIFIISQSLSI